jgi:branched-chain amino acid transport system substrate-binding protein
MANQHLARQMHRRMFLRTVCSLAGGLIGYHTLAACSTLSATADPQPTDTIAAPSAPPTVVPLRKPPGGISSDAVVLGMSAAFQGSSKGLGIELYRGFMAYLEHINRSGGIYGREVVIQAYDDGYQPTPAIENTIRLIEHDDVFLLCNYVGTPTVTRVLPLLKRYADKHINLFFPFTGAQPQREAPYDAFVFNLRASYRQETAGLVDHLVQAGRKRIAVFYQADAYGRSGWDGVRRALAKHALQIVGEATYRRGSGYAQSMQPQIQILQQTNPDAIISVGAYAACAAFIRDSRNIDWGVPIANVSFVGSENLVTLLRETGQTTGRDYTANLINSQVVPSYEDTSIPAVVEYRDHMNRYQSMPPQELLKDAYEPLKYNFVSFEGFLNAKLLIEILRRLGDTPERPQIRKVVEDIHQYDLGMHIPVSFNPDRHQASDTVYYTTVQDGQFLPITDWKMWAQ